MQTITLTSSKEDIKKAGELLRQGKLVAIPTETVYGLAADALNGPAVARIFQAKGRPQDNPLIVHIADLAQIKPLVTEFPLSLIHILGRIVPYPLHIKCSSENQKLL